MFCEVAAALNLPFSEVADLDWASGFLANVGVGLLASGNGSSGGCQHRPTGGGTPTERGRAFSPRHADARSATRQRADS